MKSYRLVSTVIVGLSLTSAFGTTNEPVCLLVPDGQLRSHPIRVYLDRDITTAMKPTLTLVASHALLNNGRREVTTHGSIFLARNQLFSQPMQSIQVRKTGTLLLIDLDESLHIPWYKAVARVTPSMAWTESAPDGKEQELHTAGGDQEIYLGNIIGAFLWTFAVLAVIVGFVWAACVRFKGSVLPLFCAPDGTLSLWRVQLLAWTLAVGSVVICFGLTRLAIPTIPDTLVALMGMSLATGGLGYLGNSEQHQTNLLSPGAANPQKRVLMARLGELLSDETGQLSVARVQMVFWTLSMLFLFLVKSFQESGVWEVPWTMVALMGISQAGYVGPKFMPAPTAQANPNPAK